MEQFIKYLTALFNVSYLVKYYPLYFRTLITIALRKDGKLATKLKGYRPIALLNIIRKVIERIIAKRM